MAEPLLVFDTNVVLDLLHFDDAAARPLLHALEAGRIRCVVTDATLEEWRRVLAYPEFALEPTQQAALVARYQALSIKADSAGTDAELPHKGTPIHYELKPVWSRMPRCSDPDDQKFIELAAASGAQGLVSKDRAVLKMRRRCAPLFRVMTLAEVVGQLVPVAGVAHDMSSGLG
ncbi:MAG: PIN domain-containing protein [Gammaproteobacteria bacterium]|nr:PIN domain-containing protein [Gammaproteobacteria bacterium]MBU1408669.1 PIN domain-containing protein [Gammaproteobacteria bacterium]MBU1532481.1 PIN domain-containing protein [Gammaproteobacteria bacterium]